MSKNKYAFLKKLDILPSGPEWVCDEWMIEGDLKDKDGQLKTEDIELWRRNPVECL